MSARRIEGGRRLRRLLPVLVLTCILLGWLRLEGQRRGLFGLEAGLTLYTFTYLAVWGPLIWVTARTMDRVAADQAHAEARRDQALAFTQLIMGNSLDAICVIDGSGRFVEASAASESLWGYSPSELAGRAYADLVHPEDRAMTAEVAASIMAGQPTKDFYNRYLRKDGSAADIHWSAVWSEEHTLMFCVARDDAPRKAAEREIRALNATLASNAAELQQTNRELEAFTYTVSHDLRAPLRHVAGYAKMLEEDAGDRLDGDLRRYLDSIGASARQMGVLIDDLLAFSRLGRRPIERLEVDMAELAQGVLAEISTDRDALSRVRIDGPLPPALADPALLKQVWVNLVSNALKYSSTLGDAARVEISGERSGEMCRYRIRDNGVGFDMRYVDKLFGVFQRLHSHEEFEGTGVGLAIVQRIVARHGGRIWAEAELDRGATFTFELPSVETETIEATA